MRTLIVGLARPMLRLLGRDERGAIGVLIAVLIGTGVLLGIGALVIDLGQVYQNRAELQNGADAAALALANSCAVGPCTPSVVPTYAADNASGLTDHLAGVGLVCGSGPGLSAAGVAPCATGNSGTMVDCPPNPASGVNYVDVHTSTMTGDNQSSPTLLPPFFARTLFGNGSYSGTNVKACAQAEWGYPSSADTIAFTISACSWYAYTNDGHTFVAPPPYPPNVAPTATDDHILYEHGTSGSTTGGCPLDNQSGADAAGNFGWTADSGNCTTPVGGGTYPGRTGTPATSDCQTLIQSDWANKTVVYVPVYSTVGGTGGNATYALLGFAAFVITGYHFPSTGNCNGHGNGHMNGCDWLNSSDNCSGNQFCIDGYFTQGLIPSTGSPGGTNLGAIIVTLAG